MIIAHHKHGLSNRIKCLVSCMHKDPEHRIYWPREGGLLCGFNDLFENDLEVSEIPPGVDVYKSWRFVPNRYDIDLNYSYKHMKLRYELSVLLNTLIPVEYIRSEVEEWTNKITNTIGVHVRSWGDKSPNQKPHWHEGMNGFDIQNFINTMEQFPECKFFIGTDNFKYLYILQEHFGDKIIHRPQRAGTPGGVEFTQDALIEQLILSKCNAFIGTRKSTFSELIWYWGGCRVCPIILGKRGEVTWT